MYKGLLFYFLTLLSISCFAEEPTVSLSFDNVKLQQVTFAIARQTHSTQPMYRVGMPKEMQDVDGISIRVADVPLSKAFAVLKAKYNVCAWANDLPSGDVTDLRVSYCIVEPFKGSARSRYRQL